MNKKQVGMKGFKKKNTFFINRNRSEAKRLKIVKFSVNNIASIVIILGLNLFLKDNNYLIILILSYFFF